MPGEEYIAQAAVHRRAAHKVDAAALNAAVDKLCSSKDTLNRVNELVLQQLCVCQ